ncbi:MAG: C25 family cysteine peptidase [Planctomycetota bacterium]|nr:C25 family cysteine peptidase [Planctomycetota bacterium]MDA1106757.1 C25 family cysteine peptidase [Planctomycetota bacterium]
MLPSAASALLVIAPQAHLESLESFVQFKSTRLPTELVSLESALGTGAGVDDAERLKSYLYGRWRADGVRYVLLVGDADILPVRYMALDRVTPAAFDYAFYPSDLYYADLARPDGSFESWNSAQEDFHAGYFGEVRGEKNKSDPINFDAIDYSPEVAVGRWPVTTPEQTAAIAAKTMRYERAIENRASTDAARSTAATDAAPEVGLVMVGGWVDARPAFEALKTALEPRWQVERRYFAGAEYGVPEPTTKEVEALFTGSTDLILHAGHGNDDCWEQCLSLGSLKRLEGQTTFPIVMSAGCSTARFATLPPYEPYEDSAGAHRIAAPLPTSAATRGASRADSRWWLGSSTGSPHFPIPGLVIAGDTPSTRTSNMSTFAHSYPLQAGTPPASTSRG